MTQTESPNNWMPHPTSHQPPATSHQPPTTLLVQCCHPAQFFFVAETCRRRFPELRLDALVDDHPEVLHALEKFPFFERVLFRKDLVGEPFHYDRIDFPLMNRGYAGMKLRAWRLSGEKREIDFQGDSRPLTFGRLLFSIFKSAAAMSESFDSFLQNFPFAPVQGRVLVVESCGQALLEKSRCRVETLIHPDSEKTVIGAKSSLLAQWKRLRGETFETAILYFSGEAGYARLKLLPYLLRIRNILAINEQGALIHAGPRRLVGFLLLRLLRGVSHKEEAPKIVLIQTETADYLSRAATVLHTSPHFRGARLSLICRQEDRDRLCKGRRFETVLTFPKEEQWKQTLELRRQLHRLNPDVVCGVFTGRPIFRKQKLFLLSSGIRRMLACNAALDFFWITPRTIHRLLRREHIPHATGTREAARVLFLPTETDKICGKALRLVRQPHVVGSSKIQVVCSRSRASFFKALPEVDSVLVYENRFSRQTFSVFAKLVLQRFDVVSAVFSRRPIFRAQKPLFFLLPARSRLAFNEGLDCFFLNRQTLSYFWRERHSGVAANWSVELLWSAVRPLIKAFLFLPRFLFLLGWVTWQKLRIAAEVPFQTKHRTK